MDALDELAVLLIIKEDHVHVGPNDFYAIADGDHIGNSAAIPLLHNDVESAMEVSKKIHSGQSFINWWAKNNKGRSLIDGGDNSVLILPRTANLEDLRYGYRETTGFTLSIGTGPTTAEADKALMVAKWKGRDQVVAYNENTEEEFKQAQASANEATKMKAEIGESLEFKLGLMESTGAAEGVEISGYDWTLMVKIAKGQPVEPEDPGIKWLQEIGLLGFSPSSRSPQLTGLGRQYLGL